jgi:hypothetical protein
MEEVRAEWIRHGLSTAPADRPSALAGVRETYRAAGLRPPRKVVWLDSPLQCVNYFFRLCGGRENDSRVRVKGLLHDGIHRQYEYTPHPDLKRVVDALGTQVDDRVTPVVLRIEAQLQTEGDPVIDRRYFPGRQWLHCVRGQFSACILSEYDAYGRLGLKPCGRVAGISRVARSAGMWWALRDVVVLCERPVEILHDSQGRLHGQNGPAITYPDGWGVHVWHGTGVPASLIKGWSIAKIVKHSNTEIRRCAVERLATMHGWPALIRQAGWRQIGSTVPDPGNPGQTLSLYRVPDIYSTPVNLLLMTNGTVSPDGTRRQYAETVPEDIADPVAAAGWQIGLPGKYYRQTVRRT